MNIFCILLILVVCCNIFLLYVNFLDKWLIDEFWFLKIDKNKDIVLYVCILFRCYLVCVDLVFYDYKNLSFSKNGEVSIIIYLSGFYCWIKFFSYRRYNMIKFICVLILWYLVMCIRCVKLWKLCFGVVKILIVLKRKLFWII